QTGAALSLDLARALTPCSDGTGRMWVSYLETLGDSNEKRRWRNHLLSLLRYSVAGGVAELAVPDGSLSPREWSQLTSHAPLRFLIRARTDSDDHLTPSPPVPRLTVLGEARMDLA